MLNLLKIELFKIFKSKSTYIILFSIILLSFISLLILSKNVNDKIILDSNYINNEK